MKNPTSPSLEGPTCPVPLQYQDKIVLGHGSGGRLSHDLIKKKFLPPLENPALAAGDDGAVVAANYCTRIAISTDSHVVWPLFFPGGDIGRLAICGTVNDIAMMGANPRYLTAGFIIEEGLEMHILEAVVDSMQVAAQEAGILVVAGDTKVVQRGKADGIYINTAGVGVMPAGVEIGGALAQPGDRVILSGPIGDHGIAVLQARGELGFEAQVESDVAPLNHLVAAMLDACEGIHVLRDPTRGGLATSLCEIALQSGVGIHIEEEQIPVRPAVNSACELLGFDPLYIANEGKLIAIVSPEDTEGLLETMQRTSYGDNAAIIGTVESAPTGRVLMHTAFGSTRIVEMLSGELLPRIC